MKYLIGGLAVLLLGACGVEQVDEGSRGIKTSWGKMVGEPLMPGLYFYMPFAQDIFEMDVRERKMQSKTECFTSDTQNVIVEYAVTYYPEPSKIGFLYSQFGKDWDQKTVAQVVLGSIKDVVGRYKADDLVAKREQARKEAETELKTSLAERHTIVTKVDFTNLDFDDAYERAVEAKVVAIQRAAEAKNKTVQVKEEAEQKILAAKADAEAMRIKSQALSANKGLVQYEAIQKWNGQLPHYMFGNSVPMINIDKLKQE